jgi:L-lysine 6-transaminase
MVEENILENVRSRHTQVLEGLAALAAENPGKVTNIRGRGLVIAFDLETPEKRNALVSKILDNGAIILPCGHRTIRFRPPLNISEEEIQRAMEIIGKSMKEVL